MRTDTQVEVKPHETALTRPVKKQADSNDLAFIEVGCNILATPEVDHSEDIVKLIKPYREIAEGLAEGATKGGDFGFWKVWNSLELNNPRLRDFREAVQILPAPIQEPVELPYRLHPLSYFKDIPKRQWGVEELMYDRGTSAWVGDGGSGKSTIVLNMMLSRIYGRPFAGRTTKQGFIVWVAAESVDEIYPRVRGWMIHNSISEEGEPPIWFLDERVPFNDIPEVKTFIENIRAQAEEMKVTVDGFVFDTYVRCTPGSDENNTQETKVIVESIDRISKAFNTHVAVIHHTNTNGKIRGSTVLKNDVDTVWSITKDEGTIKMHCEKMRGTLEPLDFSIRMVSQILDDTNMEDTAPVIVADDRATEEALTSQAQIDMLDILQASGQLSSNTWATQCEKAHKIPYSTFNNKRKNLVKMDLVETIGQKVKGKKIMYAITEKGMGLLG